MKYFLDTKFIEDGKTIDLISIAIVSEDGRELYLGNSECDFAKASPEVRENVLSHLDGLEDNLNYLRHDYDREFWKTRLAIAEDLVRFFGGTGKVENLEKKGDLLPRGIIVKKSIPNEPEIWSYYADCNWDVLCQLFGTMMDLPEGMPMYCRNIKQECDRLGNPELPKQGKGKHNALDYARWNRAAFSFLKHFER